MVDATRCFFFFFFFFFLGCMVASRGGYQMARGRHYAKLSLSNAARLSFSDLCILLFMFLSLCRLCVCVFLCSHWSLVDVPLIFFCPADHVPDWQPRVLLGMVEARSVNVKKTTTTTTISPQCICECTNYTNIIVVHSSPVYYRIRLNLSSLLIVIYCCTVSRTTPVAQLAPRNLLTRWDVSSIPANGIFLTKN